VGNQIAVTFTTNPRAPQSILYVMQTTLEDAPPLPTRPLPTYHPTLTPETSPVLPTPSPLLPTQPLDLMDATEESPPKTFTPANSLFWGGISVALFIAAVITYQVFFKRRR
jgi:hypothetical protein